VPFFIYGEDAKTGEVAPRLFSEASTEDEARRHGEMHGLQVTEVVECTQADRPRAVAVKAMQARITEQGEDAPGEGAQFRQTLDRLTPTTYVTYGLLAANVLVFVAMVVGGVDVFQPKTADVLRWGADFGPLTEGGQWWRLLAATFVHFGLFHLVYNMLAFLYAAQIVERMVGNAGFLLLYLVSGLGGSLWALYCNPLLVHAGASGAVFGVYGALGGILWMQRGSIPPHVASALSRLVLIFVGYNLLYSLSPGISLAAHVGGLVAGFLCGIALGQPLNTQALGGRAVHAVAAAGIGLLVLVVGIPAVKLRYPNLAELQAVLGRFDALDLSIPTTKYALLLKRELHAADNTALADVIENKILPRWRSVHDELAAYQPVPGPLRGTVDAIIEYMRVRQQGFEMLVDAERSGTSQDENAAENHLDLANNLGRQIRRTARARIPAPHD